MHSQTTVPTQARVLQLLIRIQSCRPARKTSLQAWLKKVNQEATVPRVRLFRAIRLSVCDIRANSHSTRCNPYLDQQYSANTVPYESLRNILRIYDELFRRI